MESRRTPPDDPPKQYFVTLDDSQGSYSAGYKLVRNALEGASIKTAEFSGVIENIAIDGLTAVIDATAVYVPPVGVFLLHYLPDTLKDVPQGPGSPSGILAITEARALSECTVRSDMFSPDRAPSPASAGNAADPFTWGLRACAVDTTLQTGRGVKVAVLDTGFDVVPATQTPSHPDFYQRRIGAVSYVPVSVETGPEDKHGHGTHCGGIACGPASPKYSPRYGIASNADLHAIKVLWKGPTGTADGDDRLAYLVLFHIVMTLRPAIISMSFGAPTKVGDGCNPAYERLAQLALQAGTLIVAAAGNGSRRPQVRAPIFHPANCPSIMAVGAVDWALDMAYFSNGSASLTNVPKRVVDIVAPGMDIKSSWIAPQIYYTTSGTSMATPHVAGIAALYAEKDPALRGQALWDELIAKARRLPDPDAGAGLVQAPSP